MHIYDLEPKKYIPNYIPVEQTLWMLFQLKHT
jgi:hypothetical protein